MTDEKYEQLITDCARARELRRNAASDLSRAEARDAEAHRYLISCESALEQHSRERVADLLGESVVAA